MDELIATIYDITVDMDRALKEENFEDFEQLLNNRNSMMIQVEAFKTDHPEYQYPAKAKQLLEDARCLDQRLTFLLKENITETQNSLIQIKQNKQVSKKFRPYLKQTNGVFLDSKK
ncbi:hypothetical protein [Neobacillus sp.]|uniref:hypothetical protein n=1 Tax=Neobacillus sp. TaxID=2675273 RepID=UPI0028A15896|nr:hypothetical protein [Neobacillus sp.]